MQIWDWLKGLVGTEAALTVQILVSVAIYGLVAYLDVIQFIRFLQNMGNRNHESANVRNEAKENIKSSLFIIVTVTVIGGIGFTMISIFMNNFISLPQFHN